MVISLLIVNQCSNITIYYLKCIEHPKIFFTVFRKNVDKNEKERTQKMETVTIEIISSLSL